MLSAKQSTFHLTNEQAQNDRRWHIVDVSGHFLGRAATQVANLLRGKHKPTYTPNVDCGDFVVVINAEKLLLSGTKLEKKPYRDHTLYPGGLRTRFAKEMIQTAPEDMIRRAVGGMLPKGPLGRAIEKKLKVYRGAEHPHAAQQPTPYVLQSMRTQDE